jgi:MFS family permease
LNIDYSTTLLIANAAAVVSYIPAGMITSKFGRKKVVIAGVIMLTTAFTCASFIRVGTAPIIMTLLFILAGVGWAVINVNSFPMAVELAKGSDVGKYTGYYYTVSMAAQVITPVLSGFLMDAFGSLWNLSRPAYEVLFPYSAIFVALAIVTMAFVKHGDSKPIAKKGLEALDVQD